MCTCALVVLTSHHESPLCPSLPLYLVRSASTFHSHSGVDGGLPASRLPARKVRTSYSQRTTAHELLTCELIVINRHASTPDVCVVLLYQELHNLFMTLQTAFVHDQFVHETTAPRVCVH